MEEPSPLDGSSTSSGNCLSNKQKYDSVAGRALCKRILEKYLPYEPHDYVLDGICHVMDGYNLLATTPTGSGKSGYYILLMLVVREIAADESLMIGEKRFPKDPVMILVLPTKALEDDMVHFDWPLMQVELICGYLFQANQMQKVKLAAIVFNSDTVDEARRAGRNLWEEARTKFTMVLLSPEELKSKEFSNLLDSKEFYGRIFALGVDEVHLLYFWGAAFRTRFRQIGFVRARLPCHANGNTPIIATTATLRAGAPMESVCQTLALHDGKYHFIRHSNLRHDIRIIFRHMRSGMKSVNFPELNWVLTDDQQIIIFCITIALGFRIATYLWRLAELIGFNN